MPIKIESQNVSLLNDKGCPSTDGAHSDRDVGTGWGVATTNLSSYSGPHVTGLRDPDPKKILGSGQLHPELEKRVEKLLNRARKEGLDVYLFEGFRSNAQQAQLIQSGRGVTQAKPGRSFHNYGLAVDIVFYDSKGHPSWAENHNWSKLGELGKEVGIEWGGNWKKIKDRPHFQYPPKASISNIKRIYEAVGLKKLWEGIR